MARNAVLPGCKRFFRDRRALDSSGIRANRSSLFPSIARVPILLVNESTFVVPLAPGFSPSDVRKSVQREIRFPVTCFMMTAMELVCSSRLTCSLSSGTWSIARSASLLFASKALDRGRDEFGSKVHVVFPSIARVPCLLVNESTTNLCGGGAVSRSRHALYHRRDRMSESRSSERQTAPQTIFRRTLMRKSS